jgi:hypothetical protein
VSLKGSDVVTPPVFSPVDELGLIVELDTDGAIALGADIDVVEGGDVITKGGLVGRSLMEDT